VNAEQAYAHVQNPEEYDFDSAIHEQAGVWSSMCIPGTTVAHCFDIDHQGKNARHTVAKGHALVVFAPIAVGGRGVAVDRGTRLAYGVAAPCLSDAAAGKLDDVLAAKLFSGKHCLLLRDRLDAAREGMAQFYEQVSPDERGSWDFETDVELLAAMDSAAGAYWGCMYAAGLHVSGRSRAIVERPSPDCGLIRLSRRPPDVLDAAPYSP
jgi:hypothetical protein